jgi:putative ABC transport system ATP-binding protein
MEALIELRGAGRTYPFAGTLVPALKAINLTIGRGESVCVAGPSGSGKSTLLHLIGCLDRPTAGELLIAGQRVLGLSDAALSRLRREQIGFVFQSYSLVPVLTAFENVEYPLVLQGAPAASRRERVRALLEEVGLAAQQDRYPNRLSGGQLQRVAIARALVGEPSLVLADEPTAHLDSATSQEVLALLQDANARRGSTLVLASHDPQVMRFARRIVRIQDGRIVSDTAAAPHVATGEGRLLAYGS